MKQMVHCKLTLLHLTSLIIGLVLPASAQKMHNAQIARLDKELAGICRELKIPDFQKNAAARQKKASIKWLNALRNPILFDASLPELEMECRIFFSKDKQFKFITLQPAGIVSAYYYRTWVLQRKPGSNQILVNESEAIPKVIEGFFPLPSLSEKTYLIISGGSVDLKEKSIHAGVFYLMKGKFRPCDSCFQEKNNVRNSGVSASYFRRTGRGGSISFQPEDTLILKKSIKVDHDAEESSGLIKTVYVYRNGVFRQVEESEEAVEY